MKEISIVRRNWFLMEAGWALRANAPDEIFCLSKLLMQQFLSFFSFFVPPCGKYFAVGLRSAFFCLVDLVFLFFKMCGSKKMEILILYMHSAWCKEKENVRHMFFSSSI